MVNKKRTKFFGEADISNIEGVLKESVNLFEETGLPDLAQKWQKILHNYQEAQLS